MLPSQKPFRGTQLNRTHPLAKGLVGCWLFNEATGEMVFDSSGNNNTCTLENGVAWGANCLKFDGVNDYISCETDINISNIMTVGAWIKGSETGTREDIISYIHSSGAGDFWHLSVDATNHAWFRYSTDNQANLREAVGTSNIVDGKCHYMIGIKDGTIVRIFIDGVEENTGVGDTGSIFKSGAETAIGRNGGYHSGYFNGSIHSVNIWNQAKSAEEAAWSYREPYAMFEPAFNPALLYSAAPPVGAIMNQFQRANLGSDLYNGVFA